MRRTTELAGFALLLLIFSSLLFPFTINLSLAEDVGGQITSDTTWTKANSPYIVTSNLLVSQGVTLTIESGVVVKFDSGKLMQIDGCLVARGTKTEPIIFTSNQLYPKPGDWKGIEFTSGSVNATYDAEGNYISGSMMNYCDIKYGGDHYIPALKITKSSPYIEYCSITNNSYTGIYVEDSRLNITNNNIKYNNLGSAGYYVGYYGGGIDVSGGEAVIKGNTISNNLVRLSGGGIHISNAAVIISGNILSNNSAIEYGRGGGIGVSSGTVTVNENIISDNSAYSGPGIYTYSGRVNIRNNTINGNTGDSGGIAIIYGTAIIEGNTITNNSNGIYNNQGSVNICLNEIHENRGNGIFIDYYSTYAIIINYNNLYDNSPYDVNNQGQMKIDATNNWWGTTDEATIQAHIYDWCDDGSLGVVTFKPYLTSPVTDFTRPTTPVVVDDGEYTSSTTWLHATWSSSDSESSIVEYQYAIGTSPGGTNIVNWTSVGTNTEVTHNGLNLSGGTTYYFAVKAKNGQGLWSEVGTSDGITVTVITFDLSSGWETKELFVPIFYRSYEEPGTMVLGVHNRRDMWYLVEVYRRRPNQDWERIYPWDLPYLQPWGERTFSYTPQAGDEIKIAVWNDLNDEALRNLWVLDFTTRTIFGVSISPQVTNPQEFKVKLATFYNEILTAVGYMRIGEWKKAALELGNKLASLTAREALVNVLKDVGIKVTTETIDALLIPFRYIKNILSTGAWDLIENAGKQPFTEEVIFTAKEKISPSVPDVRVTKGLTIVQKEPYSVGQTITAQFTITNRGTAPITFNILTVGGRGPKGDADIRDFTFKIDITLNAGDSYNYEGELKLLDNGTYHFFIAYQTPDGKWETSVLAEAGTTNTVDIFVNPIPEKWLAAELGSSAELRVYDSQGRITGLINGVEKIEISHSIYYGNIVVILAPANSYKYEIVGTGEGSYSLMIINGTAQEIVTFNATDIPTSANAIHRYTVDWVALTRGEKGATIQIDSNGDGAFEKTFTSDNELTRDEFMLQVAPAEAFPMWIVGVAVVAIAAGAIAVFWRRRKQPPIKG